MKSHTFQHQQRIAYADCTVGNHVYYARYLDLLEVARGEFFRSLGRPLLQWQDDGVAFPVTECHLRYRRPARYDDIVTTDLWLTLAKGARLNFGYRLTREDEALLLEAETHHACASLDERPQRIPPELLEALSPYVRPLAA